MRENTDVFYRTLYVLTAFFFPGKTPRGESDSLHFAIHSVCMLQSQCAIVRMSQSLITFASKPCNNYFLIENCRRMFGDFNYNFTLDDAITLRTEASSRSGDYASRGVDE